MLHCLNKVVAYHALVNVCTLEKDVRGELIEQVKKNGWKLGADIEFDKLARVPMFEGHNSCSLQRLYFNKLLVGTMSRLGEKSTREVTVDQVEEWWKNSTRLAKKSNVVEKEERIVEAYLRTKIEIC